ncbi:MAG: class I SAM-dependent methyltransferase, partial [Gaiellaceae bacterium]
AGVRHWLDRTDRLTGAFMSAALTAAEKSDFGIRLYDASPAYRGTALLPWEPAWFSRRLPPAPARILVGACGAGREVLALTAAGYTVDAFEPARTLFRAARTRVADKARVCSFRYEDLSAAVLDETRNAATELASQRYDGVLLGWGSLTHVLDETERLRLMRALDRLCPRGPLLASFWCDNAAVAAPIVGRAERYATAGGRALARLRKLPVVASRRETFTLHAGFAYRFTKNEIEALARSIDRELLWDDDDTDYPHATFVASA